MNEIIVTEIGETIESTDQYVQLLTMIYNELVVTNDNLEVLTLSIFFAGSLLAGCIVGVSLAYFIGKLMKTR